MTGRVCPSCGVIHVASDVAAMGRFSVGAYGYRAVADGTLHRTREEAQDHLCRKRQQRTSPPVAAADECAHEWLDRPESDTRECLICGTEVAG